jgi:phosphoribosylanthranilate isomerase
MNYFQVKVCGITRPQDGRIAAELGADMIGMIFYSRSPRCVTVATASKIISSLPPTVDRVGVFVDKPIEQLLKEALRLGLDWIQLHGQETPSYIRTLQQAGCKVMKAFAIEDASDWEKVENCKAELRLADNRSRTTLGGTGATFDWSDPLTRRIPNLALAGGISSRNVLEGVRLFAPALIDVNSSIESSPGIKSKAKMLEFFKVVNRARSKTSL